MIVPSRNFRRIKKVWDHDIATWPECYYLLEVKDGRDFGVWFFHPHENGLVVHVNLNEECRGRQAAESARNAFYWIFDNTAVKVIYAAIPEDRKKVHMLAVAVGFEFVFCIDGDRCYKLERSTEMKIAV